MSDVIRTAYERAAFEDGVAEGLARAITTVTALAEGDRYLDYWQVIDALNKLAEASERRDAP
jgi:hypothetical protein